MSASAQSDVGRCEVKRTEAASQFEQWIKLKRGYIAGRTAEIVYKVPVVVHVLHLGEPVGEGYNFSVERIPSQIKTLNEDYRREVNTLGFNTNPDGDDARIEFILAQMDGIENKKRAPPSKFTLIEQPTNFLFVSTPTCRAVKSG